jgi:hypothetical protein
MVLQTQASIDAEINTKLPSNDTGAVTAAALRQVLHDMNATTFQVAGSQGLINSVFLTARPATARPTTRTRSMRRSRPTET